MESSCFMVIKVWTALYIQCGHRKCPARVWSEEKQKKFKQIFGTLRYMLANNQAETAPRTRLCRTKKKLLRTIQTGSNKYGMEVTNVDLFSLSFRFWQAFGVWGITLLFWQTSSVPPASKCFFNPDQQLYMNVLPHIAALLICFATLNNFRKILLADLNHIMLFIGIMGTSRECYTSSWGP